MSRKKKREGDTYYRQGCDKCRYWWNYFTADACHQEHAKEADQEDGGRYCVWFERAKERNEQEEPADSWN